MVSSVAVLPLIPPPRVDQDQFVVLHDVSWRTYRAVRELFDSPGIRMTYFEGTLEIMSPSSRHEGVKTKIARFVELHALERDVPLFGFGSTTLRAELKERGLEPDECYALGRVLRDGDVPDIAIEVVITSGGVNKLEIYRSLGVREVWYWYEGAFQLYVLGPSGYAPSPTSTLVPGLDFSELAALVEDDDQPAALKRYRDALRARAAQT